MTYLPVFVTIAIVHVLAIASPGPTFMVVASQSVSEERRAGAYLVVGVCLATFVWASLAASGLGAAITHLPWLYLSLKAIGGAYLVWLGLRLLRSAIRAGTVDLDLGRPAATGWRAFRTGFLTNIANPKVALYYASLFGVMIPATAPPWVLSGAVLTALAVSLVWWGGLVLLFGLPSVRRVYSRARRWMDAVMGVILVGLAGRLLLSR